MELKCESGENSVDGVSGTEDWEKYCENGVAVIK